MGEACREIAKHFAQVSVILISTWGLKKLISRADDASKCPQNLNSSEAFPALREDVQMIKGAGFK